MSTEFLRARSILLYDAFLNMRGGVRTKCNLGNLTQTQVYLTKVVESPSYLLTSSIFSSLAILPYILFICLTLFTKSLLRPKNIFKSNFAASAIVHLVGGVTQLIVLYHQLENFCPQIYLLWWSATGLTASIFLIELDRFLAIRYPFKYSLWITKERSMGTCALTQLGSLAVTLAVRISSPNYFACEPLETGQHAVQQPLFLFIVVIPYFICFILSFLCALYVVKALLVQIRRDKKINPGTVGIFAITTTDEVSSREDYLSTSQQRVHRTMSCPARVVDQKGIFPVSASGGRHGSNFGLNLSDLRRDFVSTIKTLAMLFVYLLMSSPLYISAAVHSNCHDSGVCRQFTIYVIIFYHISMLGLAIYPYMWLLLDKQFARKTCGIFTRKTWNL